MMITRQDRKVASNAIIASVKKTTNAETGIVASNSHFSNKTKRAATTMVSSMKTLLMEQLVVTKATVLAIQSIKNDAERAIVCKKMMDARAEAVDRMMVAIHGVQVTMAKKGLEATQGFFDKLAKGKQSMTEFKPSIEELP